MVDPKTLKDAKNEAQAYAGVLEEHGSEMDADIRREYRFRQLAAESAADEASKQADKELRRRAESLKAKDNFR